MPRSLGCDRISKWVASVVVAALGGPAPAQVVPVVGGHALDSNMQVGSRGVNLPVRRFVPNSSNLLITGNITHGRSFRGFSPIRDPSQLTVGLGSSRLSTFRRDSVGIFDLVGGRQVFQPNPYFSPEQTVTNIGAIGARLNQPGSSFPR